MATSSENNCIDILLVGKSGQGKSSTGNSILQRKKFEVNNRANAETFATKKESLDFQGRKLTVVDTPGIADVRLNNKQDIEKVISVMSEAMAINLRGYHAIGIVVKFGCRFTAEDVNTMQVLKKIFGDEFMQNHGILLFTCGDNFETDDEVLEKKLTFEDWLARQTEPHFQAVIKECSFRTILFNNRCRDETAKEKQLERLIDIVKGLTNYGKRYTNKTFERAEEERNRLWKTSLDTPRLKTEHLDKYKSFLQEFGRINVRSKNLNRTLTKLQNLQNETETFLDNIRREDHDSDAFLQLVECLNVSIKHQLHKLHLLNQNADNDLIYTPELEESTQKRKCPHVQFQFKDQEPEKECLAGEDERPFNEDEHQSDENVYSFGEDESQSGEDERPSDENERPSDEDERPSSEDKRPFGEDERPFGEDERPFGEDERPFGEDESPSGEYERPFREDERPYGEDGEDPDDAQEEQDIESDASNQKFKTGESVESRGVSQMIDTHIEIPDSKLQSQFIKRIETIVTIESEKFLFEHIEDENGKECLGEQHWKLKDNASQNNLDEVYENENGSHRKLQLLIEKEEKDRLRMKQAKDAYDNRQAELARLEEEKKKIIQQSEEQQKIIEDAEKSVRMTRKAKIEHQVLEKIKHFLEQHLSEMVLKGEI